MTMTETTKKRGGFTPQMRAKAAATRAAKKAQRAADPPPPPTPAPAAKAGGEFAGMTRVACASGCNAERCVVSQKPYCAHPRKGGLQSLQMNDPKALARLETAKERIDAK